MVLTTVSSSYSGIVAIGQAGGRDCEVAKAKLLLSHSPSGRWIKEATPEWVDRSRSRHEAGHPVGQTHSREQPANIFTVTLRKGGSAPKSTCPRCSREGPVTYATSSRHAPRLFSARAQCPCGRHPLHPLDRLRSRSPRNTNNQMPHPQTLEQTNI